MKMKIEIRKCSQNFVRGDQTSGTARRNVLEFGYLEVSNVS